MGLFEDVEAIIDMHGGSPVSAIYDAVMWNRRLEEIASGKRTNSYLHASSLPYCMRGTVLSHLGIVFLNPDKMRKILRIFDNGHAFHERLQGSLKKAGVLYDDELFVCNDDYRIGGSIDGKVEVGFGEEILELKSINSFPFSKSELPLEKHKEQASVYMFCTGIYRTRFLYESKNDQEHKEIVYRLDEDVLARVLSKSVVTWRYINACIDAIGDSPRSIDSASDKISDLLPIRTCITKNQKEASNCLHCDACFAIKG